MHLRGPMNVSQLAVYQLPSDMHTLQKRNTIPFYNRRRALQQRNADFAAGAPTGYSHHILSPNKRTINITTGCAYTMSCAPSTTTVTIIATDCEPDQPTNTVWAAHDTTYVGAAFPYAPILSPLSQTPASSLSDQDRPCENKAAPATALERPVAAVATPLAIEQASTALEHKVERRAEADWSRVAYYTSTAPAQATGLSFLANLGDPQKSGTFD
jgi:hypothetical protein